MACIWKKGCCIIKKTASLLLSMLSFLYRVEANNSNFKSSKLVVNSCFIFTKTL